MTTCERCGEENSDDSGFCGRCGAAIVQAGSVASLVDGAGDPESPGAATTTVSGTPNSEWVAPPAYGETAAVAGATGVGPIAGDARTPDPAQAPTTTTPVVAAGPIGAPPPGRPQGPHGAVPLAVAGASGGPARTTNIVFASLAVALVVIIGGIFLLLSTGGDGDEFARSGADPTTPIDDDVDDVDDEPGDGVDDQVTEPIVTEPIVTEPVVTEPVVTEPVVVDPVVTDSVATTEVDRGTAPVVTEPVSTTAPPTTAPPTTAPPTTAPPTTAPPTTAPPTTASGRGSGDLGLAQPILDAPCTGGYVTFVGGIVGGDDQFAERVEAALEDFPDSEYLSGGICSSIRTRTASGDEIYGIVYGPFESAGEACGVAEDFSSRGAYVRRLTESEDDIGRGVCGG